MGNRLNKRILFRFSYNYSHRYSTATPYALLRSVATQREQIEARDDIYKTLHELEITHALIDADPGNHSLVVELIRKNTNLSKFVIAL